MRKAIMTRGVTAILICAAIAQPPATHRVEPERRRIAATHRRGLRITTRWCCAATAIAPCSSIPWSVDLSFGATRRGRCRSSPAGQHRSRMASTGATR